MQVLPSESCVMRFGGGMPFDAAGGDSTGGALAGRTIGGTARCMHGLLHAI